MNENERSARLAEAKEALARCERGWALNPRENPEARDARAAKRAHLEGIIRRLEVSAPWCPFCGQNHGPDDGQPGYSCS